MDYVLSSNFYEGKLESMTLLEQEITKLQKEINELCKKISLNRKKAPLKKNNTEKTFVNSYTDLNTSLSLYYTKTFLSISFVV